MDHGPQSDSANSPPTFAAWRRDTHFQSGVSKILSSYCVNLLKRECFHKKKKKRKKKRNAQLKDRDEG